uniref:GH18 domain-containing protein n=1 Tax=Panagrolaimus sp. PS1159 TaxID=55785 RepID=A0AC35FQC0_9BILA
MMVQKILIFLLLCFLSTVISDYVRGCYFSDWAHYRPDKGRYEPEMYIPGTCTHIFFAFAKVNDDFTAGAYDDEDTDSGPNGGYYKRVNNLKSQQPGLITILSFGGWSAGTDTFKKLAADEGHRQTFINSALQFINHYGFDGIDIDWEYPKGDDYNNYVTLLKELKQADNSKLLTAAVTADAETVDEGYNVKEMAKHLDYVNVMTYDFHGDWEQQTGKLF